MTYAGFWKRFTAMWIDFLVLLIPLIFLIWVQSISRPLAFAALLLSSSLYNAYEIYFHGNSGQTIGKRNQGIRVVSLDGSPISWSQAFLRSSVSLSLSFLYMVALMAALAQMSNEEYSSLSWGEQADRLGELSPFDTPINVAMQVWGWSEVFSVLFNRKRRALHDFLAGTVVVEVGNQPAVETAADSGF